ncbi:MAG: hypothetical protein FJX23_10525 [Alphaproteobacteria bacterium]|nr:hypothetical protein [Alphaproteobacteria bacterium]
MGKDKHIVEPALTDFLPPAKKPKKIFRRTAALGTAVGLYFGGPYIDMATDSYDLPPMTPCDSYSAPLIDGRPDAGRAQEQAILNLFENPGSRDSLVIQSILASGGAEGRLRGFLDNHVGIDAKAALTEQSQAYDESCGVRGILQDISIFNPLRINAATYDEDRKNPENFLEFKAVANYQDPVSANKVAAYFHEETGTLVLAATGRSHDENADRAIAVATGNLERLMPYEFMDNFLGEVKDRIRQDGLKVNNTTIFGHSLGVSGAIVLKGMLETSHANQVIFGKQPVLTLVEGFGESLAAEAVSEKFGIPQEKLVRNSISARSGGVSTANIVAAEWDGNHTVGEKVYSLTAPGGEEDTHGLHGITRGLMNGSRTSTLYSGDFSTSGSDLFKGQTLQVAGKLAKIGRDLRQATGLG